MSRLGMLFLAVGTLAGSPEKFSGIANGKRPAMATDQDFDDYDVEVVRKPIGGVELGEIPEKLKTLLDKHLTTLTREDGSFDPDHEAIIRAKDEPQASRLLGYAKAWGGRQTPAIRVTKMSNGKRYDANIVRLKMEKDEEVAPENRPGRKPGK